MIVYIYKEKFRDQNYILPHSKNKICGDDIPKSTNLSHDLTHGRAPTRIVKSNALFFSNFSPFLVSNPQDLYIK